MYNGAERWLSPPWRSRDLKVASLTPVSTDCGGDSARESGGWPSSKLLSQVCCLLELDTSGVVAELSTSRHPGSSLGGVAEAVGQCASKQREVLRRGRSAEPFTGSSTACQNDEQAEWILAEEERGEEGCQGVARRVGDRRQRLTLPPSWPQALGGTRVIRCGSGAIHTRAAHLNPQEQRLRARAQVVQWLAG